MEFVFVAFQTSDSQCKVEMVKRFGEGVTMQDIESFAVNRTLEEMKEHARKKEISLFKKIKSADVSLYFTDTKFFWLQVEIVEISGPLDPRLAVMQRSF